MDLATALSSAPTPTARAALLTVAALRGDGPGAWTPCTADGSPTEPAELTQLTEERDAYFRTGPGGDVLHVKWVPMDDTRAVLIAQRCGGGGGGGGGERPLCISLSASEEPLASALRHAAADPHAAARALRAALLRELHGVGETAPVGRPCAASEPTSANDPHRMSNPIGVNDPLSVNAPLSVNDPLSVGAGSGPLFAGVAPRPPGFRYGDADLFPGGAAPLPGGGMHLDPRAFAADATRLARYDPMFPGDRGPRAGPLPGGGMHLDPRAFAADATRLARYDPMFPGDRGPRAGPPGSGAALFRGEPDPDELRPLGGNPFGPGSAFGPGRMGGFGGGPW